MFWVLELLASAFVLVAVVERFARGHTTSSIGWLAVAVVHIAQKKTSRTLDARTTRHPGYALSQCARKRIEEVFGWMKTVGGLRKLRHRGGGRVNWQFLLAAAAYNLVRMRTLDATA